MAISALLNGPSWHVRAAETNIKLRCQRRVRPNPTGCKLRISQTFQDFVRLSRESTSMTGDLFAAIGSEQPMCSPSCKWRSIRLPSRPRIFACTTVLEMQTRSIRNLKRPGLLSRTPLQAPSPRTVVCPARKCHRHTLRCNKLIASATWAVLMNTQHYVTLMIRKELSFAERSGFVFSGGERVLR